VGGAPLRTYQRFDVTGCRLDHGLEDCSIPGWERKRLSTAPQATAHHHMTPRLFATTRRIYCRRRARGRSERQTENQPGRRQGARKAPRRAQYRRRGAARESPRVRCPGPRRRRRGVPLRLVGRLSAILPIRQGKSTSASKRKRPVQGKTGAPGRNRTCDTRFRKQGRAVLSRLRPRGWSLQSPAQRHLSGHAIISRPLDHGARASGSRSNPWSAVDE
jgi:hypothetical protein